MTGSTPALKKCLFSLLGYERVGKNWEPIGLWCLVHDIKFTLAFLPSKLWGLNKHCMEQKIHFISEKPNLV